MKRGGCYTKIDWIFILLGIVCALSADKIDKAANADKKLRNVIWVCCGGLVLISVIGIVASLKRIA